MNILLQFLYVFHLLFLECTIEFTPCQNFIFVTSGYCCSRSSPQIMSNYFVPRFVLVCFPYCAVVVTYIYAMLRSMCEYLSFFWLWPLPNSRTFDPNILC